MKLAGIFFIIGLILAASDGPWFPWVNLAGVALVCLAPAVAWRADRKEQRRLIIEKIQRR